MTDQIDYSKVDWTGLKLPYGFELQIKNDTLSRWVSHSLSAEIFSLVANGHIGLNCARLADFAKASECVGLIDAHAQKWLAKQNVKRTEVVRFEPRTIIVEKGTHEEFSVKSTISKATADAIFAGTVGCRFEIVINKIG